MNCYFSVYWGLIIFYIVLYLQYEYWLLPLFASKGYFFKLATLHVLSRSTNCFLSFSLACIFKAQQQLIRNYNSSAIVWRGNIFEETRASFCCRLSWPQPSAPRLACWQGRGLKPMERRSHYCSVALFQSSLYEISNSRGPVVNYLKKYCAINLAWAEVEMRLCH